MVMRFLLRMLLLFAAPALVVADEPTRILLVSTPPDHPWASHMYEFECDVLARCLRQTPGVEATTAAGWPVPPAQLEETDALVCYSRPAGELLLQPDHRHLFVDLMEQRRRVRGNPLGHRCGIW